MTRPLESQSILYLGIPFHFIIQVDSYNGNKFILIQFSYLKTKNVYKM